MLAHSKWVIMLVALIKKSQNSTLKKKKKKKRVKIVIWVEVDVQNVLELQDIIITLSKTS